MPVQEIIASLHLFEEAAQKVFPRKPPLTLETYAKFDKLNHIRIILMVEAYFGVTSAATGTRIQALEHEAARLPRDERSRHHGIVSASPVMRVLYQRIEAASRTPRHSGAASDFPRCDCVAVRAASTMYEAVGEALTIP